MAKTNTKTKAETKTGAAYRPSPPATAGDAIDISMKTVKAESYEIPKEAVLASMVRSFAVTGEQCFEWYQWSPHKYWAVAQIEAMGGEDF